MSLLFTLEPNLLRMSFLDVLQKLSIFSQEKLFKNKWNHIYTMLQFVVCSIFFFFLSHLMIYLGDLWWEVFEEGFYIEG